MLQLTHYCGMRVGEVAALKIEDVVDENYKVRAEIVLAAERTKSKRARRIFCQSLCNSNYSNILI